MVVLLPVIRLCGSTCVNVVITDILVVKVSDFLVSSLHQLNEDR